MHYLIVYGKEELKQFEKWKLDIKNREQFYRVSSNDVGMGIFDFKIEDRCGDNVYHVLEENEALKYYGGSSLYLNEIYCTKNVDSDSIINLYGACVRKYTPFLEIGLSNYDFKNISDKCY